MLPRIEDKAKDIKPQPWYRERLREKYLTKNNSNNKEKLLDAKQWVFIKDGLDDFRDGLPPPHNDVILKPSKGPAPIIKDDNWTFKESVLSPANRLSLHQRCYSKKLPLAQAKRDYIENIINDLSQHPLALYSHLEDALPPDLFDEILDILDPEINEQNSDAMVDSQLQMSSGYSKQNNNRDVHKECKKLEEEQMKYYAENREEMDRQKQAGRNNYKWLLKKEEQKVKAKGPDQEQMKAQAIDDHIKRVTEDYCNWVKSVNKPPEGAPGDQKPGGEHNIDPTTITSLFASGYETKPPLSVPINVVDMTNIPNELRSTAYIPEQASKELSEKNIYRDEEQSKKDKNTRYGAWYLPKEHWRLMGASEKLTDPKKVKDTENKESKKKTEEINLKLAPLYGAKAFKDYIKTSNPKRVPKLIEELDIYDKDSGGKCLNRAHSLH